MTRAADIAERRTAGWTIEAIATDLGISNGAVAYHLRKAGLGPLAPVSTEALLRELHRRRVVVGKTQQHGGDHDRTGGDNLV